MNRTITMNLSGIIFHIEEDAYEKLNKYLSAIKGYFQNSDGRDEILNDIEARIAEMLQEKVSSSKQAVLMADVDSVISAMGKPEDFAGDDVHSENADNAKSSDENKNTYTGQRRRRVFRDTDNKMISGVCAGIANYFDFDPIWLRGAFAISFFVFGSGFLLYVVLWMIMPEAKTTAEKLEMRGEKVDVNNIGKAVNEEFEDFKKRMKNFGDEVKSPENKERIKTSAQKAGEFVKDVLYNIITIFAKVMAVLFVIIGIILMVALLATLFGRGTISMYGSPDASLHFSLYELSSAILPNDMPIGYFVAGIILFLGIPLLSIIYAGVKYLFGIKQKNKIVKYTANTLWLCGLGLLMYVGFQLANDFSEQASVKQKTELIQPKTGIFYLDAKPLNEEDINITYHQRHRIHFGNWIMISKDENKFRLAYPTLNIVKSETDSFELVVIKTASGFDKKEAGTRAKNINYVINQADSSLKFNSYYDIDIADKLHAQDVKLILKVPVGKTIFLSERMKKIIFDIDNVNDALDNDMVNRKWIMTRRGLECIDCEGLDNVEHTPIPPAPAPAPPVITSNRKTYSFKIL